jgi:hypothetical protein
MLAIEFAFVYLGKRNAVMKNQNGIKRQQKG